MDNLNALLLSTSHAAHKNTSNGSLGQEKTLACMDNKTVKVYGVRIRQAM